MFNFIKNEKMKKRKLKMFGILILLFVLLGLPYNLIAQEKLDFITIDDNPALTEKLSQNTKIDKLKKKAIYKNIEFVKIGELTDFINNGVLTFKIPNNNGKFKAKVKEFKYVSQKDFVWKGNLIDQYGSITIISEKGCVFGYIAINNQYYEIQNFEGKNVFVEIDHDYASKYKDTKVKESKINNILKSSSEASTSETTNTGIVRVLVLYTAGAQASVANIYNTATIAVSQFNEALRSSDILSNQLTITLAGTSYIDFTETPYSPSYDLGRIKNDPQAQALRTSFQADVVVLLVDDVYWPVAGLSPIGPPVWSHEAYNMVVASCATANYTFTHEIAHLFGCRHQYSDDNYGPYEHAYSFTSGWWIWKKYWKTVMHNELGDDGYTRILAFSNPNVEHWNNATGTPENNNARKLVEESITLENLRPYIAPPSVYISGPHRGDNLGTYTWSAAVTGGQSPYTYQWQFSLNGYDYYEFGYGQTVTGELPYNSDLYLQIIMTDAQQNIAYDWFLTVNSDASSGGVEEMSLMSSKSANKTDKNINKLDEVSIKTSTSDLNLYPNPAQSVIAVKYFVGHSGKVKISIINSLGVVVKYLELSKPTSGMYEEKIQLESLQNGLYYLQIKSENKEAVQTVIISR